MSTKSINPFAHRALFDCATTLRVVEPYLPELIAKSYEREIQIFATQAPFETKDALRMRGYRWDREQRVWVRTIFESQLQAERAFLADEVYPGDPQHVEREVTAP